MVNLQEQIFNDTLDKLGLSHQKDRLISKAKETLDRISLKIGSGSAALNDQAKLVICVDITCELLNIPFDADLAVKISAIRKSEYKKQRQMFLKLMNLNKKLDVPGLLMKIQVSNTNVEKAAKKIFEEFQTNNPDLDLDHPQYVVMSCFQACKLEKAKVPKKNFITMSNLTPPQWILLERSWDKWVCNVAKTEKDEARSKSKDFEATTSNESSGVKRKLVAEPEIEEYEVWAKRTLAKAYADLKKQQK